MPSLLRRWRVKGLRPKQRRLQQPNDGHAPGHAPFSLPGDSRDISESRPGSRLEQQVQDVIHVTPTPRRFERQQQKQQLQQSGQVNPSASTPSLRKLSSSSSSQLSRWASKLSLSSLPQLPQLHPDELDFVAEFSGLAEDDVRDKFEQYCFLSGGKPKKGINSKQFLSLYKRAYPDSVNPSTLANSVFRLCDQDADGTLCFSEYVSSICIPPISIPTVQKYETLFHIWDYQRCGHLSPGTLITILRDVFDILGMHNFRDFHKEAMQLFSRMDWDRDCKIGQMEFVTTLLHDHTWVRWLESCNFCVPHSDIHFGKSTFWISQSREDLL